MKKNYRDFCVLVASIWTLGFAPGASAQPEAPSFSRAVAWIKTNCTLSSGAEAGELERRCDGIEHADFQLWEMLDASLEVDLKRLRALLPSTLPAQYRWVSVLEIMDKEVRLGWVVTVDAYSEQASSGEWLEFSIQEAPVRSKLYEFGPTELAK